MRNFLKDERGATAIEYGLIASLIAIAIVGVLVGLGPKCTTVMNWAHNIVHPTPVTAPAVK